MNAYRGEIIDVHNHLITSASMRAISRDIAPRTFDTFDSRFHVSTTGTFAGEEDVDAIARRWIADMDALGIGKIVWFPFKGFHRDVYRARELHPDRVIPFVWFDMTDPGTSLAILEDGIEHHGVRGIKINPSADHVHPHDKTLDPLWELASRRKLAVVSHYGISMAPNTDMRYIDPTNIQPVAMAFPDVNFIVAHMGAGYVKESLFLTYHDFNRNIFFDCSGSGAWLSYLPYDTTIEAVYKRFIDVGGIDRLLFGSDSNLRGYRKDVLERNLDVFAAIGLEHDDIARVMAGNARKVLHL